MDGGYSWRLSRSRLINAIFLWRIFWSRLIFINYIKIFILDVIKKNADAPYIKGFTSNPSLMAKYEIKSYEKFINEFLKISQGKPVSFEVCSDDLKVMYDQAKRINEYGKNIFGKTKNFYSRFRFVNLM